MNRRPRERRELGRGIPSPLGKGLGRRILFNFITTNVASRGEKWGWKRRRFPLPNRLGSVGAS